MAIRITCINKDNGNHENPNVAITHLGWKNEQTGKTGKNTRLEIYNWIKDDKGEAYVIDGNSNKVKVITAETNRGIIFVPLIDLFGARRPNFFLFLLQLPICHEFYPSNVKNRKMAKIRKNISAR